MTEFLTSIKKWFGNKRSEPFAKEDPNVWKGFIGGFSKLYKVGNLANKGLHVEDQNNFSKKEAPVGDRTQDLLVITLMPSWLW